MEEKMLWGIRLMRTLSASAEVLVALALWQLTDLRAMIRLNSMLGLVGPLIFVGVSALGLAAGMGKIPPQKLLVIFLGVALVLWGSRS